MLVGTVYILFTKILETASEPKKKKYMTILLTNIFHLITFVQRTSKYVLNINLKEFFFFLELYHNPIFRQQISLWTLQSHLNEDSELYFIHAKDIIWSGPLVIYTQKL